MDAGPVFFFVFFDLCCHSDSSALFLNTAQRALYFRKCVFSFIFFSKSFPRVPFFSVVSFLKLRLACPPSSRSLAITSVNTVVMQTANVTPPITQSVAFYLHPRSFCCSLLHVSESGCFLSFSQVRVFPPVNKCGGFSSPFLLASSKISNDEF